MARSNGDCGVHNHSGEEEGELGFRTGEQDESGGLAKSRPDQLTPGVRSWERGSQAVWDLKRR